MDLVLEIPDLQGWHIQTLKVSETLRVNKVYFTVNGMTMPSAECGLPLAGSGMSHVAT